MGRVLFVLALLFSVCMLANAQDSGSGSGSGSGNGTATRETCGDLQCSHGCNNETDGDPVCYCPIGYSLALDMRTCLPCPGGLYGINCESICDCGETGNTCDRMSGTCVCNLCYSGVQCEAESGSSCFVQFLEVEDKSIGNLRGSYGLQGYPVPPEDRLQTLAADLMDTDADLISNVMFNPIPRSDVGQGPLVQLSWVVDKNLNRVRAEEALSNLSNKVKLGDIRATYIAQDSTDTTLVTLNSGVKDDPI